MRLPHPPTLMAWLADPAPAAATATADAVSKHPWLDWWKALPGSVFFGNWDAGVFERSFWESCMHGFWVVLALTAATLLVLELWVPQFGARVPQRVIRRISIALTVLGAVSYFSFFNPNVRYKDFYHRGEFYHHYLGAKYFEELGYTRLYECTAIAEIELGKGGAGLRTKELRDLSEPNLIIPMAKSYVFDAPDRCKEHFTTERWDAFRSDVSWFENASRGPYWDSMKKDHGYDSPPVWTLTGKFFASLAPPSDTSFKWLASLDVLLQVATLAAVVWGFGWRIAAITSVFWGCNAVSNFYWTGGAFLHQDWLFLLVLSMAGARRGKFGLSGAAITWSALLRVFPAVAAFGYFVIIGSHWLRHRSLAREHKRFLAGCGVALAVLVPSSLVVAGGDSYKEFAQHVELHHATPFTNHMGLPAVLAHEWDGRMRFTHDESVDGSFEEWKVGRLERTEEQTYRVLFGCLAMAAWVAWVLAQTRSFWLGIPLSVPLLFAATNLPCYDYVIFIALAPLVLVRRSVGPLLLVLAALSQVLLERLFWIDDRYVAMTYLFGAAGLLCLWVVSRAPSKVKWKALWQQRAVNNGRGAIP
jgi:hypothetical protein